MGPGWPAWVGHVDLLAVFKNTASDSVGPVHDIVERTLSHLLSLPSQPQTLFLIPNFLIVVHRLHYSLQARPRTQILQGAVWEDVVEVTFAFRRAGRAADEHRALPSRHRG